VHGDLLLLFFRHGLVECATKVQKPDFEKQGKNIGWDINLHRAKFKIPTETESLDIKENSHDEKI